MLVNKETLKKVQDKKVKKSDNVRYEKISQDVLEVVEIVKEIDNIDNKVDKIELKDSFKNEVSEEKFCEMLTCLPPLKMNKKGFIFGEMLRDNIAMFYIQKNNKFYEIEASIKCSIDDIYYLAG